MKLHRTLFALAAIFAAVIFPAAAQPSNDIVSAPVYVPDESHMDEPLPDGVIAWDATLKAVDVVDGTDFARFTFSFTNITPNILTILNVHPSCGCTTAELPPVPWQLSPGTSGEIKLSVNLAGKAGILFKTVGVKSDKGKKDLMLRINITPAPVVTTDKPTPPGKKTAEQVVVTADRRETSAARSTASVERVDTDDIRERGYVLNTWQWLEGLAGVDAVSGYGGIDGGLGRERGGVRVIVERHSPSP